MPSLIILRLHPVEPITGDDFTNFLNGLSIAAHEASFNDPKGDGPAFATAPYIAPALPASPAAAPPHPNHDPNNRISQHYAIIDHGLADPPNRFERAFFAVATAVFKVPDPPAGGEYQTTDVRLTITRTGGEIIHKQLYYNLPVITGTDAALDAIIADQNNYQGLGVTSLHLALPSPGQQLGTTVVVPEDGTAPEFANLRAAVENVLNAEPGNTLNIANLTFQQCRHIAYEIIWDRMAYPLPVPHRSLEAIYTGPQAIDSDDERGRRIFEGDLLTYYVKHNGEADRLANFIFALSAAIWCEEQSGAAEKVGYYFPVFYATPVKEAKVILQGPGAALDPAFLVPAEYYYALGAIFPPQIKREQRFKMASLNAELQNVESFVQALDEQVFTEPAAVNRFQAARRLRALGATGEVGTPVCIVGPATPLHGLLIDWLAFAGPEINDFWAGIAGAEVMGHLVLILCVITKEHLPPLITDIPLVESIVDPGTGWGVSNVMELTTRTVNDWRTLFQADPALLPEFTKPGSIDERIEIFILHLRKFFDVAGGVNPTPGPVPTDIPAIERPVNPLDLFLAADPGFTFEGWDGTQASIQGTLNTVFPGDPEAQAQFVQWLNCFQGMLNLTVGIAPPEMRFAVMEALWARGITNTDIVHKYTEEELREALTGSIAYYFAHEIWVNAGSFNPTPGPGPGSFKPVNPDGSLTNCIPPDHRSPLGPVAYLHDLLLVSEDSDCEQPIEPGAAQTLAALLTTRRGPLGGLLALKANLEVPIPLIDIVNESLEFMVATSTDNGTIYNTARDSVGGHELSSNPIPSPGARQHDPETLFEVLPEHSTPATPVVEQTAYEILKSDFSAPDLPYNQALDINCTYLKALGTCRYEVMHRFCENITEFVLNPSQETPEFQRHLFRYPVRIEVAISYFCMSPEEYTFFTGGGVIFGPQQPGRGSRKRSRAASGDRDGRPLYTYYGFSSEMVELQGRGQNWTEVVTRLPEFLKRTGLSYCEFIELWKSGFVVFHNRRDRYEGKYPECEPCCLDDLFLEFDERVEAHTTLYQLLVFIRLWRKLQDTGCAAYSFEQLRDICEVLQIFIGPAINPDFIRQLVAFQIFRDDFQLSLTDGTQPAPGDTGADRMHLLAFWAHGASKFNWAAQHLLNQIQQYAIGKYKCECRPPEFIKLLLNNLDDFSIVAGFEPVGIAGNHHWHEQPTKTLRYAEILAKIYASKFTIGELFLLFTASPHLQGDDPFPLQTVNEANENPFDLPDDEEAYSLMALRQKLLDVKITDEETDQWTWPDIEAALIEDFGMEGAANERFLSMGQHFFPNLLAESGIVVGAQQRQYRMPLAAASTSALLWNTPPEGPFRYNLASQELFSEIPLADEAVLAKLFRIRQLSLPEQTAVQGLYFQSREDLARFAFIFNNFREAEEKLIQEPDETIRWKWFRYQFALCHARCRFIAKHLAEHVVRITGQENPEGAEVAQLILKSLWAVENSALSPWEADSGVAPAVTWQPKPNGGAYAALLGLVGTGMPAEYFTTSGALRWREVRGGTDAFGPEENDWNAPVPTVLPTMNLTLTPNLTEFISLHNGLARSNVNDVKVGGAEPFMLQWKGLLLIENSGKYAFMAGAPTPDGEAPDFEKAAHFHKWRVRLNLGQKEWVLLSYEWPDEEAPSDCSKAISLKAGMYQLRIDLERNPIDFNDPEDVCPQTTGFQLKYNGPDSEETPIAIPFDKLFLQQKNDTLRRGIDIQGAAGAFLDARYVSTVRDIRLSYQLAFKSMLFAHRLELSAQKIADDGQSELGYMLANPVNFAGQSYYRAGPGYNTHRANFDFNFWPLLDNYHPLLPAQDQRVDPSLQRQQALFDWWERLYDYTVMRREASISPEHPAWLLFHESNEVHPDDISHLLRHIGVSVNHSNVVQLYNPDYELNAIPHPDDLDDDRWAVRAWQAEKWLRNIEHCFYAKDIREARPDLWASLDPNAIEPFAAESGNVNLTKFYRDGCIENEAPLRYENIKKINDGLRERGRAALVLYLTQMNRVTLPWGDFATEAKHLSELLLLDVETGLCQKASRIEEAVSAIQLFVQRARLGLEPGFVVTADFILVWDRHFASFRIWEACKRREIYLENWIEYQELEVAQRTETYQFLEYKIREATLTVPVPGSLAYWNGPRPPGHPGVTLLQNQQPATMELINRAPEGLGLIGTPDRHARPSWLAPLKVADEIRTPKPPNGGTGPGDIPVPRAVVNPRAEAELSGFPLWFQAVVRLGVKFLRIAAADIPPASTSFTPKCGQTEHTVCCEVCGKVHPALMDEIYFWLEKSKNYREQEQDANWGTTTEDTLSDWHRPEKLPGLLHWNSEPTVHLHWGIMHNGEFLTPRKSDKGLRVTSYEAAQLEFRGRVGDSLFFSVTGGLLPLPEEYYEEIYPESPLIGFRYDIATDEAIVLPEVVESVAPLPVGGLAAFPFFALFDPGAPLLPPSMYSPAVTMAGHLRAHCQFESALKWLEIVYAPLHSDNTWTECLPDRREVVVTYDPAGVPTTSVVDYPEDCCCASNPVNDDTAKNRHILMLYLETLVQWGDALMRINNPEAFAKARLILDTANRILGTAPISVQSHSDSDDSRNNTVGAFKPDCAPLNPRLLCLYCTVSDRLSLIHACLNAKRLHNGRPNTDMPYFGTSKVRECWKITDEVCLDEYDWCLPQSPYRFLFLVQKAQEIAGEVRALGSALLAAYEKGDAEYLASIRALHERQLLNLSLEIRQNQWREADWQVQALRKTKQIAITRLQYYQNLIAVGLIDGEIQYEPLIISSTTVRAAGNIAEAIGQAVNMIPDPYVGFPANFVKLPPGTKMAMIFTSIGKVANTVADILNSVAQLGLVKAGFERREQEWEHQVDVLTIEIEQIERQINAAERRRDIALRELNNHQQQMDNAAEVHDFLRDKFTNHALFLWMQQETAAMHYQMYELALHCVRQAQRAFNLERGHTARKFIPAEIWDNLHEGLLSGERLSLTVRQMEKAYYDLNEREYELTKHVSLRLHAPEQLLQLRERGYCEVELPEWFFDLENPGHFMRRIKAISLTIPCVAGPYTSVNCRLTLLSSRTRVSPKLCPPSHGCCKKEHCTCDSYEHDCCNNECCKGGGCQHDNCTKNGYSAMPDDPRIVNMYAATEAIATSSGQNDSGMFELNFNDSRYLPFEYAGAVSRWRIELPQENNFFDMSTLTDVVMHLSYMAREGGDLLRKAANKCAQEHLPGDGLRYFDVKQEMPDAWYMFQSDERKKKELLFSLNRQMFPFLPGHKALWTEGFDLFFETEAPCPANGVTVQFKVDAAFGDLVPDECDGDILEIHCVRSAEWPNLYHGALSLRLGPIPTGNANAFGIFIFPAGIGKIDNVYLLIGYNSEKKCKKECCC